jgi:6-phosphogluconolactonase
VLRFVTEVSSPEKAALALEASLRGEVSRFDLVLLGLGADGHTASLFPGTEALDETVRLAVATRVEKLDAWRLTLTLPVVNAGRDVVFLVVGSDKAEALRRVLERDPSVPASRVRPGGGRLTFFLDREAAARLP